MKALIKPAAKRNDQQETCLAIERTLAIIKPDAVGRGLAGEILSRIHKAGFAIVGHQIFAPHAEPRPKASTPCIASKAFSASSPRS